MKHLLALIALITTTACAMPKVECTTDEDCEVRVAQELGDWADSISEIRNQEECDQDGMWDVCHEDQVKTLLYRDHTAHATLALAVIDGKMLIWVAPQVEEEKLPNGLIRWTWGYVEDGLDDGLEIVTNDEGIVVDVMMY